MKLGFLTACLPSESLDEIAEWAQRQRFESLEVAVWPKLGDRPFTASHIDVAGLTEPAAREIVESLADKGLEISSLAFYDNNLHPDADERAAIHRHVHHCIDAAAMLGVESVGTFIGRDPGSTVVENLATAENIFGEFVRHADETGTKLVIENCVMEGWHPDGYPGNLAYSPELWEWMFSLGLYLNYDPSHLLWMGIDPVEALRPYVDRIPHAQAKDLQLFPEKRNRYGYPGKAIGREDPFDVGWWRYRVPGLGDVDWRRVVDTLYEGGFAGTLSIEHEDPVWGGTPELVRDGLTIAARTLRQVMVP